MNMTAIAIVAIVCWAIVELVNGPKGKKKEKKSVIQNHLSNEIKQEMTMMRERIETLEKIVTDEKYDLERQFKNLDKDKVA